MKVWNGIHYGVILIMACLQAVSPMLINFKGANYRADVKIEKDTCALIVKVKNASRPLVFPLNDALLYKSIYYQSIATKENMVLGLWTPSAGSFYQQLHHCINPQRIQKAPAEMIPERPISAIQEEEPATPDLDHSDGEPTPIEVLRPDAATDGRNGPPSPYWAEYLSESGSRVPPLTELPESASPVSTAFMPRSKSIRDVLSEIRSQLLQAKSESSTRPSQTGDNISLDYRLTKLNALLDRDQSEDQDIKNPFVFTQRIPADETMLKDMITEAEKQLSELYASYRSQNSAEKTTNLYVAICQVRHLIVDIKQKLMMIDPDRHGLPINGGHYECWVKDACYEHEKEIVLSHAAHIQSFEWLQSEAASSGISQDVSSLIDFHQKRISQINARASLRCYESLHKKDLMNPLVSDLTALKSLSNLLQHQTGVAPLLALPPHDLMVDGVRFEHCLTFLEQKDALFDADGYYLGYTDAKAVSSVTPIDILIGAKVSPSLRHELLEEYERDSNDFTWNTSLKQPDAVKYRQFLQNIDTWLSKYNYANIDDQAIRNLPSAKLAQGDLKELYNTHALFRITTAEPTDAIVSAGWKARNAFIKEHRHPQVRSLIYAFVGGFPAKIPRRIVYVVPISDEEFAARRARQQSSHSLSPSILERFRSYLKRDPKRPVKQESEPELEEPKESPDVPELRNSEETESAQEQPDMNQPLSEQRQQLSVPEPIQEQPPLPGEFDKATSSHPLRTPIPAFTYNEDEGEDDFPREYSRESSVEYKREESEEDEEIEPEFISHQFFNRFDLLQEAAVPKKRHPASVSISSHGNLKDILHGNSVAALLCTPQDMSQFITVQDLGRLRNSVLNLINEGFSLSLSPMEDFEEMLNLLDTDRDYEKSDVAVVDLPNTDDYHGVFGSKINVDDIDDQSYDEVNQQVIRKYIAWQYERAYLSAAKLGAQHLLLTPVITSSHPDRIAAMIQVLFNVHSALGHLIPGEVVIVLDAMEERYFKEIISGVAMNLIDKPLPKASSYGNYWYSLADYFLELPQWITRTSVIPLIPTIPSIIANRPALDLMELCAETDAIQDISYHGKATVIQWTEAGYGPEKSQKGDVLVMDGSQSESKTLTEYILNADERRFLYDMLGDVRDIRVVCDRLDVSSISDDQWKALLMPIRTFMALQFERVYLAALHGNYHNVLLTSVLTPGAKAYQVKEMIRVANMVHRALGHQVEVAKLMLNEDSKEYEDLVASVTLKTTNFSHLPRQPLRTASYYYMPVELLDLDEIAQESSDASQVIPEEVGNSDEFASVEAGSGSESREEGNGAAEGSDQQGTDQGSSRQRSVFDGFKTRVRSIFAFRRAAAPVHSTVDEVPDNVNSESDSLEAKEESNEPSEEQLEETAGSNGNDFEPDLASSAQNDQDENEQEVNGKEQEEQTGEAAAEAKEKERRVGVISGIKSRVSSLLNFGKVQLPPASVMLHTSELLPSYVLFNRRYLIGNYARPHPDDDQPKNPILLVSSYKSDMLRNESNEESILIAMDTNVHHSTRSRLFNSSMRTSRIYQLGSLKSILENAGSTETYAALSSSDRSQRLASYTVTADTLDLTGITLEQYQQARTHIRHFMALQYERAYLVGASVITSHTAAKTVILKSVIKGAGDLEIVSSDVISVATTVHRALGHLVKDAYIVLDVAVSSVDTTHSTYQSQLPPIAYTYFEQVNGKACLEGDNCYYYPLSAYFVSHAAQWEFGPESRGSGESITRLHRATFN